MTSLSEALSVIRSAAQAVPVDLSSDKEVEIRISRRGDRLWINVDGECVLRCVVKGGTLVIADEREEGVHRA